MDDSERRYLLRKHRGGESSRKGNQYEDFYAVFSILREMSKGHVEAFVSSQVEEAYVDDLLIDDGERKTYHQLKNVEKLSWGDMQHGDLKYDFIMQGKLCKERSEKFFLKLVVTHDFEKLNKLLPTELADVATVEFYPMLPDFNRYVYYPVFADVAIQAIGCESFELEKVENVSTVLLGLWEGGRCRGLNVGEVWAKMRGMLFGGEEYDAAKAKELCELLEKMGFSVLLRHGVLDWSLNGFAGSLRLSTRKIDSLLVLRDVEEMIQNLI